MNSLNVAVSLTCVLCLVGAAAVSAAPIAGVGIRHWDGTLISIDNFTPIAGTTTQAYAASDQIAGTNSRTAIPLMRSLRWLRFPP